MGNFISKCCGKNDRKYKKKIGKVRQPEQEDKVAKIVTNNGVVKDVPSDETQPNKARGKTDEGKQAEKKGDKQEEKKGNKQEEEKGDKHNRRKSKRKKYDSSDDSSVFSSSSSSDSSSSDSDTGHVKSSRKVYKNKGGGTTIVSKKTVIGGNKMTIGKNARNITINIGSDKKSTPVVNKEEKKRPFESFFTESSAREEERRQFASPWGQNALPPGGNFIDTREIHIKEFVFESSVRVDASSWVCMIRFPGGNGTGFRVGPRYIMTANHVVKHILDIGYQQVGERNQDPFLSLQSPGVYAIFDFKTDGPESERQKFRFKAHVPFYDDATDCAVLELEDNSVGTALPLSFTYFSLPRLDNRFTFIGHSLGSRMEFNHVDRIIDINSFETQRDIIQVKQMSIQQFGKDYEMPPHNILTNAHRFLFHCKFTKGASGSPGVVILPDGRIVVVTMLLCGLPDWYYDPNIPDDVKIRWPKEYCVEQGVNLKSVYEKMSQDNQLLCQQIFCDLDHSIPAPNI